MELLHNTLLHFTYLVPNFWGSVPHAVNPLMVLFFVAAIAVALKLIAKFANVLLFVAILVLVASHSGLLGHLASLRELVR